MGLRMTFANGFAVGMLFCSATGMVVRLAFPYFLAHERLIPLVLLLASAMGGSCIALVLRLLTRRALPLTAAAFGTVSGIVLALMLLPDSELAAPASASASPPSSLVFLGLIALSCGVVCGYGASLLQRVVRRPWVWLAGASFPLLLLAAMPVSIAHAAEDSGRPPLFLYGLDAGTWTVLNDLFSKDDLPSLRRLRDEGSSGVLQSEQVSLSPRLWTTIATGKQPEKHGILDFWSTQDEHLRSARLWDILAAHGYSVGLFQWLVTWPPDPHDPFVIPGWMARGPETHPSELSFVKELEQAFQTGALDALKN